MQPKFSSNILLTVIAFLVGFSGGLVHWIYTHEPYTTIVLIQRVPELYVPETEPEWLALLFEQKAREAGLSDQDIAILKKIAMCESGFRSVPNRSGSSAFGAFQPLKVHDWRGDRYKAEQNLDIGIQLYLEQGSTPWNASRHCWSNLNLQLTSKGSKQ